MFCDDKESQANAKRIKNQWDELSSTDKVNEYLFEASGVPRRTLVSTGLLSISPSLECIQLTDFFQQILRKNISKDLTVNRIRYAVKVGADDRRYLLLSAQERDYKNKFCLDYYSPFYDTAIGGTT